jgi:hypothetical protein
MDKEIEQSLQKVMEGLLAWQTDVRDGWMT